MSFISFYSVAFIDAWILNLLVFHLIPKLLKVKKTLVKWKLKWIPLIISLITLIVLSFLIHYLAGVAIFTKQYFLSTLFLFAILTINVYL